MYFVNFPELATHQVESSEVCGGRFVMLFHQVTHSDTLILMISVMTDTYAVCKKFCHPYLICIFWISTHKKILHSAREALLAGG